MRKLQTLGILLLWVVSADRLPGQVLPFENYSTRDGLPSNQVNAILQDSRGYLWVGTSDGISIFDGTSFKNYTTLDGLPNNYITDIVESKKSPGVMWIATLGGVARYSEGRFQTINVPPRDHQNLVHIIFEDHTGGIWCATSAGVICLSEMGWSHIEDSLFARNLDYVGIVETRDSLVWVGSPHRILVCSLPDRVVRTILLPFGPDVTLSTLVTGAEGEIWGTASDSSLLRFSPDGRFVRRRFPVGLGPLLFDDMRGNMWVSVEGGLSVVPKAAFPDGHVTTYTALNGLPELSSWVGIVDREGDIWLGSLRKGLSKLAQRHVFLFHAPVLPYSVNNSAAVCDAQDHLFLASVFNIQEIWREPDGRWMVIKHPMVPRGSQHVVMGVTIDSSGQLWVRVENGEIRCYTLRHRAHLPSLLIPGTTVRVGSFFPSTNVQCLLVQPDGRLRVALEISHGSEILPILALFDVKGKPRVIQELTGTNGLPASSIRALFQDSDGSIWVGSYETGLSVLRGGGGPSQEVQRFVLSERLPDNGVRAIFRGADRALYIGTRYGGLAVLRDSILSTISLKEGLLSSAIWGIAEDEKRNIWLGTSAGMQCLDKETGTLRIIRELAGDQVHSCGVNKGKFLWFVTSEGLTVYDYPLDETGVAPPPVYIDRVDINGQQMSGSGNVSLRHDQNTIAFGFVGISLRDEGGVHFRYRMLGVDSSWSGPTDQRTVTFATLRPGSYTFQVKASNSASIESSVPASFAFVVVPPYWERWWFVLMAAVMGAGILYGAYRYRVSRLLELERIRLRIAGDLHDDVGTNLSSIVVASQILQKKFPHTDSEHNHLVHVERTALQAQEMMRDIVWVLNPSNDSLDDFLRKLKEVASRLLGEIPYSFDTPPEPFLMRLGLEFKRNVLLIFKEALNNIVKHASAANVGICIRQDRDIISMMIQDDGTGFSPDAAATTGSGLGNMRRRAEAVGGRIDIRRRGEGGTIVELTAKIT